MGKLFSVTLSVLQLGLLSLVNPTVAQDTSISQPLYDIFALYGEYAAASYCASNIDPYYRYTQLECISDLCPSVTSAQSKITLQLNNVGDYGVNGYVAIDYSHNAIVFAIRGTDSSVADPERPASPLFDLCSGCYGRTRFYNSWTSVRDIVLSRIMEALDDNPTFRVVVTGHSFGGAIATIAAFELRRNPQIRAPIDLATYGAPRVGNSVFASILEDQEGLNDSQNYRITHIGDVVPNTSTQDGFVQSQPNYIIESGNRVTPGPNDIFVNTDPDTVTPQFSRQDLLNDDVAMEDFTDAAHAMYIDNIEACAGRVPPPENLARRSIANFNADTPAPPTKPAAKGALIKNYLKKAKAGKVKTHEKSKPNSRGRKGKKAYQPARNIGHPENKKKPKGSKKAPSRGKPITKPKNGSPPPKSSAPPAKPMSSPPTPPPKGMPAKSPAPPPAQAPAQNTPPKASPPAQAPAQAPPKASPPAQAPVQAPPKQSTPAQAPAQAPPKASVPASAPPAPTAAPKGTGGAKGTGKNGTRKTTTA